MPRWLAMANLYQSFGLEKEFRDSLAEAARIDANNPDLIERSFAYAVRKKDSRCRRLGLVILALRGMLPEAETFVGKGANRALALEDFPDELPQALFRLLEVPPRFAMRAIS